MLKLVLVNANMLGAIQKMTDRMQEIMASTGNHKDAQLWHEGRDIQAMIAAAPSIDTQRTSWADKVEQKQDKVGGNSL